MKNVDKLRDILCTVDEIKEDIMELRFGTIIKNTVPAIKRYVCEWDYEWYTIYIEAVDRNYQSTTIETEEWEEMEIIWNGIEERHLRMYCDSKWIEWKWFIMEVQTIFDILDNTKSLQNQSEETLWQIIDYLTNI